MYKGKVYMKRFFYSIIMSFVVAISYGLVAFKTQDVLSATQQTSQYSEGVFEAVQEWNTYNQSSISAVDLEASVNLADNWKNTGALPTATDRTNKTVSIGKMGYDDIPYAKLFDVTTEGWGTTNVVLEFGDAEYKKGALSSDNNYTIVSNLVSGLSALKYNSTEMIFEIAGNFTGTIEFLYRAVINKENGEIEATNFGTITILVENVGVYMTATYNGGVSIPEADVNNYTYDAEFFRQYIAFGYSNGTTIPKESFNIGTLKSGPDIDPYYEVSVDKTVFNTTQYVSVSYYEVSGLDENSTPIYAVKLTSTVEITFTKEIVYEDTVNVFINGNLIGETTESVRHHLSFSAGERISGEITCTTGVSYGDLTLVTTGVPFILQTHMALIDPSDPENSKSKKVFELIQYPIEVGTYEVTLQKVDNSTGFTENIYLQIEVTTTVAPTINLYQSVIELPKGSNISNLDSEFRTNISSITLFDGSSLDRTSINNSGIVVITCDIESSATAGDYAIRYSYICPTSGLEGNAVATLSIIDEAPEVSLVLAKLQSDSTNVLHNGSVPITTPLYFVVTAVDPEEDTLIYYASSTKGELVQDLTENNKFYFEPNAKIAGPVTFSFEVSDGNSISEEYIYTVTFVDETAPTITFKNSVTNDNGTYKLNVDRKVPVYFRTLIENVADNSSTLSTNDVTIEGVNFTLDTGERFLFSGTGNYTVKYTLQDDSGNEVEYLVSIIIINSTPTAENKTFDFSYTETAVMNLYTLAKDDTAGYEIVGVGHVTDEHGTPLEVDEFSIGDGTAVRLKLRPIVVGEGDSMRQMPYIGNAYFRYKVIDSDGEFSPEYIVTVNFADDSKPVVTATEKSKNYIKGRTYPDFTVEGYFTAVDDVDGVLEPISITIYTGGQEVESVAFDAIRTYRLKYLYRDAAGNETERTVDIEIITGGAPSIELLTTETTIALNGSFDIFNFIYRIRDEEDGDKTSGFKKLQEDGALQIDATTVDTAKSGKYTIRMYYVDSDGNASETIEFILTVEEPKEFPMEIIYIGGGAVGLILLIIVIRVIIVKRRMRI